MKTRKVDSCGYVPVRQKTKPLPKARGPGVQTRKEIRNSFLLGASVLWLAETYRLNWIQVEEVLRGGLRPKPKGKR